MVRNRIGQPALAIGWALCFFAASTAFADEPPAEQAAEATKAESESPSPSVLSVRVQVTVFQVSLPRARMVELDAEALAAQAGSAGNLSQALQALGDTDVLYRIDQQVATAGGSRGRHPLVVSMAKDVPRISGTAVSEGKRVQQLSRSDAGIQVDLSAYAAEEGKPSRLVVSAELQLKSATPSDVPATDDVPAPVFWKIRQTYSGSVELGKPIVLLSADGQPGAGGDQALAFVTLMTLSTPHE